MRKIILIIWCIVAFLLCGYIGDIDRVDQIVYTMPSETYYQIKDSLSVHGREPSDKMIVEFYLHKFNKNDK